MNEHIDQEDYQGPSTTTSNSQQEMASLSSALSAIEPQSSYHTNHTNQTNHAIDPWFLYGGNIAAACQATNAVVDVHHRTKDEEKAVEDEEKKRQRANSRLTAWQSRERKRIEFEVLQERESELKKRNQELQQENEKLKIIIDSLKTNATTRSDDLTTTIQQRNDMTLLNMQSRLLHQRVSSSSSLHSVRQPSRNFDDTQQQLALSFQTRPTFPSIPSTTATTTSATSIASIVQSSSNQSFSDAAIASSLRTSRTGSNMDLRFSNISNMEPNPLRGGASFSNIQYLSARERGGRLMSSSFMTEEGNTSQQGIVDTMTFTTPGMNTGTGTGTGNLSNNFLFTNNDMLAPTIFAPLFRGDPYQEQQQQQHQYNIPITTSVESGDQNPNRHLIFGSTLPFLSSFNSQGMTSTNFPANLSSYLNSASLAEEKVDVPLFRAIRTGTGPSHEGLQSQQLKRKRSSSGMIGGKDSLDLGHDDEQLSCGNKRRNNTMSQHSMTSEISDIMSRGKDSERNDNNNSNDNHDDDNGDGIFFSTENVMENSPSMRIQGRLSSSFSSTNLQDDDANDKS